MSVRLTSSTPIVVAPPNLHTHFSPELKVIGNLHTPLQYHIENKHVGNKESSEDWRSKHNHSTPITPADIN